MEDGGLQIAGQAKPKPVPPVRWARGMRGKCSWCGKVKLIAWSNGFKVFCSDKCTHCYKRSEGFC